MDETPGQPEPHPPAGGPEPPAAAGGQAAGGDAAMLSESTVAGHPAALAGAGEPATGAGAAMSWAGDAAALLASGGPVVAILATMSVFALCIVLAKALRFAGPALGGGRAARRALGLVRAGRPRDAWDTVAGLPGLEPHLVASVLAGLAAGRSEARLREEVAARTAERLEALRSWLRPLEVIAALAPLLGLFGTVLGMIEAFAALERAGSRVDPAALSGGIWEALLTTAVGLAVAIPAVVAFNWFERRIERAELACDGLLAGLLSAEPRAGLPMPAEEEPDVRHPRHRLAAAAE